MSNVRESDVKSFPAGMEWAWRDESEELDNPPLFEIITWRGYSKNTGEFSAVLTKWSLATENKLLHLEHVSMRHPYGPWNEFPNPAVLVPDSHKRKAREIAREYFDMGKFKSRTRLYPQKKISS